MTAKGSLCSGRVCDDELYSSSKDALRASRSCLRTLWPLHVRWILPAALSRSRSACRFSRSACAFDTVLVAFETTAGLHEVLAKGLPAEPLRFTFRGRLELPVNVENMATVVQVKGKQSSTTPHNHPQAAHVQMPRRNRCGVSRTFRLKLHQSASITTGPRRRCRHRPLSGVLGPSEVTGR